MDYSKNMVRNIESLVPISSEPKRKNLLLFITVIFYFGVQLYPLLTFSQNVARVISFKHTMRWLNESNFPNHFLLTNVRDSINATIQHDLIELLKINNVSFPDKVEYQIITGFGKPRNSSARPISSAGYDLEINSFLTRATSGYAVYWSVNIVIRKDGNNILEKEVKHEIEYSNASGYMTSIRWLTPIEFQSIFKGLFREAIGLENKFAEKIIVGRIEEKEKEIKSWFPESSRFMMKKRGSWLHAGNFAAQLEQDKDTLIRFIYKNKPEFKFGTISLKPILADLFTATTGIGTTYTIKEKERKRGVLEFSNGKNLMIGLNWIEEITTTNTTGEVQSRITVPLVGQIFNDTTLMGNFIYEKISTTLSSEVTKEKFSWVSGPYTENSYGTAVIHRIIGKLQEKPFVAEYNELFGHVEVKIENQTLACMIFQNCNPENGQSFDNSKLSKNKRVMSGANVNNVATPSLENEVKLEWYPIFIRKDFTSSEMETGLGILVCLFFGIGNM